MRRFIRSIVLAACAAVSTQAFAEYAWVEAEDAKPSVKANIAGWGNTQFLSGEKWMHITLDADKLDQAPGEAVTVDYPFSISKAGEYEIWNRIGMEFVRSPFEWRVGQGEWKAVASDELTTDLMELAQWTEVAWLQLGKQSLNPGQHVLQIRLPKTKDKDGKPERILYASDAVCITDTPFRPNGRFRPDETGRDEKDLAAEKNVFKLPETAAGARASVALAGDWEVTRHDEQAPGEVAAPIGELPQSAVWRAIPVPSDKNKSRPDLVFAHRIWYRTRVEVPQTMAGRAYFIDFPLNNLNTTVYVNGQLCGFFKDPFARFQIDVTKAIKPGTNEIMVGIRDAWYGRTADPERPMKLRRTFNIPLDYLTQGFQDLDYPIWNCPQSGLLATPSFVAAGQVYVSDVFAKPSVEKKQMIAEVTVSNPTGNEAAGEIRWEAIDDATGQVAKTLAPKQFKVAAGKSETLEMADGWDNAKLWWPDQPQMYRLRTIVAMDGKTVDTQETPFGFREWKVEGTKFTLNGIVWHLWADLIGGGSDTESWLKAHRESGVRTYRYSTAGQAPHDPKWFGLEPEQALAFMDKNGIVVRRNSTLDGETIGSKFSEDDEVIVKKQGGSKAKLKLMQNWIDQCVSQVKGERNHPSIQIWTIENEFAYINLINLLGNSPMMDEYEGWIKKCHDAVMAVDPTRSVMIDGGGALKDNTLGVHGDHYVNGIDGRYPDLAYEPYPEGGGRGRWKWDQKRPRFIGEDFFATGVNPADYAVIGGEVAFQGKAATRESVATVYRMLQEGYRWGGHYAAWHFWVGGDGGPRSRLANAPRAVFTREWDWSFPAGGKIKRTFGVFNDSQYPDPITFTRTLTIDGKQVYTKTSEHQVKPGTAEKFDEEIEMPTAQKRVEGELLMTLSVGGKEIFRDTKNVSVLPAAKLQTSTGAVVVFDPKKKIIPALEKAGVAFTAINTVEGVPADAKLLIVGPDAIEDKDSTSTAFAAFASLGKTVIVLDQAAPLKFQAIPAEMALADPQGRSGHGEGTRITEGRTAFIEDASHPILAGLQDKDLFTWTGDHVVFHDPYVKPTRGGKSLVQVGPRLSQTALVEVPVGTGVMYLCQLDMGEKLATSAAAQQLLANLVSHGINYKQEIAQVSAAVSDEQLAKALDGIGLQYDKANDVLAAIDDNAKQVAVISATPENLKTLAANMPKVQAFWDRGGQILLHGLTPEGLADYNKIVGVDHVIRPFVRERVTFPMKKNPLTAGITTGDIVMLSGKRVFGWTADEYVADDVFKHVVDIDDIAPFGKSSFHAYANIVNGFVGSDGWPLIIDFPVPTDGKPFDILIDLPREETITELTYDQSLNYGTTSKIALLFDGKDRVEFAMQPNGDPQTFTVEPARKAKQVTLQIVEWTLNPAKQPNVGIDNISLKVARDEKFQATVKPMLNLGGMVQYTKGKGGVVLCNLNLQENEAVPANKTKKRTILAAVLRNLKAPFAGGKTVIAGANLTYQPLDIHTKATTYKDAKNSFFGDKNRTFAALPPGKHNFAGVQYDIYEMPTSPVPQVLMLGGPGVPGELPKQITDIPVNAKADALFFLHAAKIGQRMNDNDRRDNKRFTMFKYVIHYVDGQTAEVPVYSEIDVEHYVQKQPKAIPGAQIAWSAPFEGSDEQAVAYAKQWDNPRSDVEIKSVDMVTVEENRGTPVLLAITAAKAP